MEESRLSIGGNSAGLEEALTRFDLVGFMLARLETLAMAVRDDRLDRACLKVLAALIETMNRETRTSWAGRDLLSDLAGISVKSVSNYIYQLKCLGYVVSERRSTPQANNRVLMHYTLSALSPQEIETAIDRAISSIRGHTTSIVQFPSGREVKRDSSRQDGKSVPAGTGTLPETSCGDGNSASDVPARTGTQLPVPTGSCPAYVVKTAASSRQDGCSKNNSSLTTSNTRASGERGVGREKSSRGSRLPKSWTIPAEWGRWTTDNFDVRPSTVRKEAEKFRDYWIAQPAAKGVKLEWFATWRNWIRKAYAGKEREGFSDSADLLSIEPESENERQLALVREMQAKARLEDGLD